jgi:hypothetical protein
LLCTQPTRERAQVQDICAPIQTLSVSIAARTGGPPLDSAARFCRSIPPLDPAARFRRSILPLDPLKAMHVFRQR